MIHYTLFFFSTEGGDSLLHGTKAEEFLRVLESGSTRSISRRVDEIKSIMTMCRWMSHEFTLHMHTIKVASRGHLHLTWKLISPRNQDCKTSRSGVRRTSFCSIMLPWSVGLQLTFAFTQKAGCSTSSIDWCTLPSWNNARSVIPWHGNAGWQIFKWCQD